jgi:hypothetical protein
MSLSLGLARDLAPHAACFINIGDFTENRQHFVSRPRSMFEISDNPKGLWSKTLMNEAALPRRSLAIVRRTVSA